MSKVLTVDDLDDLQAPQILSTDDLDSLQAPSAQPPVAPPSKPLDLNTGLIGKTVDTLSKVGHAFLPSSNPVLTQPLSKSFGGYTGAEAAETLAPENPPELANLPKTAFAYDVARRTAKTFGGFADWMQSPLGIATSIAHATSAGADAILAPLLGSKFTGEAYDSVKSALDDMSKNGATPENVEQYLSAWTQGLFGAAFLKSAKESATSNPEVKLPSKEQLKAIADETNRIQAAADAKALADSREVARQNGLAEAKTRKNQAERRATLEVPETTTPEDATQWLTDDELDALTKPDEQPAPRAIPQPVDAGNTASSVHNATEVVPTTTASAPPAAPEQADLLDQLTTPEATPAEPVLPQEPEPKPESTLQSFHKDTTDLKLHEVRGGAANVVGGPEYKNFTKKLQDAAENAPDASVADYLDKLRSAAETHFPDALEAVDRAQEALASGDRKTFALEAENARSQMSHGYQERLAQDSAKKLGIELPEHEEPEKPTVKPAPTPRAPKTEEPPKTAREQIIRQGADIELADLSSKFNPEKISLVEFLRGKGGVKDEGGELASREVNKQTGRGVRKLVQANGLPLDTARELAAEGGYLPETSTISDLLDLIDDETRGKPVYSANHEGIALGESPLANIGATPKEVGKALEAKSGALYRKIVESMRSDYDATHGESIDNYLSKATNEQRRDLLGEHADALNFEEGDSKPLLGKTEQEASTLVAGQRRLEQLKEGKVFDENELVNSELFGGKGGGPQQFLGTDERSDDVSFDFGANIDVPALDLPVNEPNFSERMDRTIEEAKQRIKDRGSKASGGKQAGHSPLLDDINDLITIGAAHLAKGIVDFADWSAQMVKDFGDQIKPHLERIYQLSQEALAKSKPPEVESVESASQKYGVLGGVRRSIADTFRKIRDYGTLDPVPNLSRAGVQEQAVNHAYARIAVPRMINDMLSQVFPDSYKDPAAMQKAMHIMVLDNILGGHDDLKAAGKDKLAENVEKQHDLAAYHEEVTAAMEDDATRKAIQRWKKIVNPVMDQLYNEMKGMDPDTPRDGRGRVFGARVNLLAKSHEPGWLKATVSEDQPLPSQPTPPLSSFRNPNVRQDRFDRSAKFTAAEYSSDPVSVLAAALFPRWNEVTKRRLYNGLVSKGWASWERPESGTIHGQEVRSAPVDIPQTVDGKTRYVRQTLWLPKNLHEEFRGVLGTDLPLKANPVSAALTKLQLAQLADATSHLKNIHSVIAGAQGTKGLFADVVRKMPGISSVDAFTRIGKVMYDIYQDDPSIRKELADMGKKGMLRQHFPATGIQKFTKMQDLIHSVDTASRVVMNRFYDNLVDRGLSKDNFDSRRNFVQQIGEYNKRLMGPLMRGAAQSGLSPFIVAGRNFNRFSRRLLTGNPGFEAASRGAAIQARLVNFTTLGTMFVLPAMLNQLSSGTPWGRPGTPIGAIDLGGKTDAKGNHKVLDLLQLYGVRRGMRAIGAESISAGLKNGDSANDIVGKAIGDAVSTAGHPWLGPALGFATQATTGQRLDLRGGPMPEEASKMEGRGSQFAENMRVALKNQNLLLYSPLRKAFSDIEESPGSDFAKDFLKSPASAVGISDRVSPAIQAARDAAVHVQTTPEQKERSQARRQILAAYDKGDAPTAERLKSEALKKKLVSATDVSEINRERRMAPIERAVWKAPLATVLDSWDKASPDEKTVLRRIIASKVANAIRPSEELTRAQAILRSPR